MRNNIFFKSIILKPFLRTGQYIQIRMQQNLVTGY
jgi:hypothetical protein